jgi:glutamate dehydrogenase (NAD(P)+)
MNIYEINQKRYDKACKLLGVDENIHTLFRDTRRTFEVDCPIEMDDGKIKVFTGYRVQHTRFLGPTKGGIRYAPFVDLDEVKGLAFLMTWKSSLMGLPYGGAKGGIEVNPKELSMKELEKLTRRYTEEMDIVFHPKKDIPAPDMNTNPQIMHWIYDTYSKGVGYREPGVVTGKSEVCYGIEGRNEATGYGVAHIAMKAVGDHAKLKQKNTKEVTYAVQGFGNVGSFAARTLRNNDRKIVAVSDYYGALYNKDGLDVADILRYVDKNGSLDGYTHPETQNLNRDDILTLEVDVLCPCALENVITKDNAEDVKAEIIVEGANSPLTGEADKILNKKGIKIIPDILANAGGVTVSYFEWVQARSMDKWKRDTVLTKLIEDFMFPSYNKMVEAANKYNTDFRTAAFIVAIDRVVKNSEAIGFN